MHRRNFVRGAIFGASVLATGSFTFQWMQIENLAEVYDNEDQFVFLTREDKILLIAILPGLLGEAISKNWEVGRKTQLLNLLFNIDTTIQSLSEYTQFQLRELFNLLWSRLGKWLLAGVWNSWSLVDKKSIESFLTSWRNSPIKAMNEGYLGLQQVILGTFYSDESSWGFCQYPGPPIISRDNQ